MVQTISIASGKGGVGKTSLAVNLSLALSMDSHRVALFDADFGMANGHILLNQKVEKTLFDMLESDVPLESVIKDHFSGLKLIPGGSGVVEMLNIDQEQRFALIRSLDMLSDELDFLIVDTPAGGADSTIDFAAACDKTVVVLTPEPTSFMDAYSLIKVLSLEKESQSILIVVNLVNSAAEAQKCFENFVKIVDKFLSVNLQYAGYLPKSSAVNNSIVSRKPFILDATKKNLAPHKNIHSIKDAVTHAPISECSGIKFFT